MKSSRALIASVCAGATVLACGSSSEDPLAQEALGKSSAAITQSMAPWHLDRIDQRSLPLDTEYNYSCDGAVDVYVMSTGIEDNPLVWHDPNGDYLVPGATVGDCIGIGTAMAGLIRSPIHGVAKGARLHSVTIRKCIGGTTTDAEFHDAIQWLKYNAPKPGIVVSDVPRNQLSTNMLNDLRDLATNDMHVILPIDPGYSAIVQPDPVFTQVVSTDDNDGRMYPPVNATYYESDLSAPGYYVETIDRSGATVAALGNEFAAAIVAGVAAQYLEQHPTATPAQVKSALDSDATPIGLPSPLVHVACP